MNKLETDDPNIAEEDYDPETLIREIVQEVTDGDHLRTTALYMQHKARLLGRGSNAKGSSSAERT